jgi:hypothetical protein
MKLYLMIISYSYFDDVVYPSKAIINLQLGCEIEYLSVKKEGK